EDLVGVGVPELLLVAGELAILGVGDDVLYAEELGVLLVRVEEDALVHRALVLVRGVRRAIVLDDELELGVLLGDVEAAEVGVGPSGGRPRVGFGFLSSGVVRGV